MTKTILFLGAAHFQLPPILYAQQCGYRIITADNRPDNPGHKLAHCSYHISSTDKKAILNLAKTENIDGVLSFASDVSAPTAAFVANQLQLPGHPYNTVLTLTNKSLFRKALNALNLQPLPFQLFNRSQASDIRAFINTYSLPVIVKPTHGSGSRGITIVRDNHALQSAIDSAFNESPTNQIIIEKYIERAGKQLCGDGYMQNGKLIFFEFGDGHVPHAQSLVPCAETFPTLCEQSLLKKVKMNVETILKTLGFQQGTFNLDAFITKEGEPFIVEIGPRSGGNYIPRAIYWRTGIDLVAAAVESSLDSKYRLYTDQVKPIYEYVACYMLHTFQQGILEHVEIDPAIKKHILEFHPYLSNGDKIIPFTKGNAAIGNLILQFDGFAQMQNTICNMKRYYNIHHAMENVL